MDQRICQALEMVAQNTLGVSTLNTQNSDDRDFHDLSVWSIKKALKEAYELGKLDAHREAG